MSDRTVAASVQTPTAAGAYRRPGRPTRQDWRGVATGLVRHPVVVGAVALLVVWFLALGTGSYQQYIISLIALYAVVGAGLVLLVGVGGQLTLGHATFLAVGAYTAANISTRTSLGLPLELLVAVAVAVVVGVIVGLPSLRLSGLLLAAGTLALGFAAQQLLFIWKPMTGGGQGMTVGPLEVFGRQVSLVTCSLVVLALSLLIVYNLLRGRSGRALHAIRTADTAARSVGIEVERRRIAAFAISGALCAAGGVLYGHGVSYLSPESFDYTLSIQLVIMVIIGGQRRLFGAVLGSAFVIGLPEQFRTFQKYQGIGYGLILLAVIVFAPGGLVELVDRIAAAVSRGARALLQRGDGARLPEPPPRDTAPSGARAGSPVRSAAPAVVVSAPGLPLVLEDMTVHFGGVLAVRDLSLEIPPGQVLGIIGPNGAGKTTLFNGVCGVVRARGRVRLGDRDLSSASVRHRSLAGIGRTFQNLSLHEGLTPVDHVLIGRHRFFRYGLFSEMARLPHVVRAEKEGVAEAMSLLELVGLADVALERGDDLPYGMQKRVDVARALAARPRILLLDEPAAGLPPDEADSLIDHVLELTRPQGTTVVIIEHNVDLVRRVSDRIVAMAAGGLLADGLPDEVLENAGVVEAYLGG